MAVEFDPERCGHAVCVLQASHKGRARLRERVGIEHHLLNLAARQGPKARYKGGRKNLFDLRLAAAIQNLETNQRNGGPLMRLSTWSVL